MSTTIKNPVEWGWDQIARAASAIGSAGPALHHIQDTMHSPAPTVRRIGVNDVKDALLQGLDDFGAFRSDVVFLCIVYPVVGLIFSQFIFGNEMMPLLFPIASGFALVGPFAALGLYEMSRRRERGLPVSWLHAFDVVRAPAFGAIAVLGLALVALFLLWLTAAWGIYRVTLGPELPTSISAFASDIVTTQEGWTMIAAGIGVGFVFALVAMTISIASFPLLVDRDVGLDTAIRTSIKVVTENPGPMAVWGMVVAGSLALGSIPFFIGLIVVMPTLGHATWHLYRKTVAR
ncbi:MAG: DUF2189 domain-containing protein [Parvibaculum sp.]|uniref:DUF2189 domain-containing protein n=1 Tax=Parvibaculum sp. TaxID=2024848 RepID=UPI0025E6B365|nr:DUF2189 domain-containing protein [Parvibaculum sp.]MCE9651134.1 DUF2189 domain-containing protein [Parvibaculum sp.]